MMKILSFSAAILLAAACTSPQKPQRFSVRGTKVEALANIRSALAEKGLETETVDEEAGIMHTAWVDTGFMYGEVQDTTATIVRRYTVVVQPTSAGHNMLLRVDTKRCAQDSFVIDGLLVSGACEEMTEVVGPHQEDLNALGAHLHQRVH